MYNLLVLLLMLCFCNIPFAESSYCNCVCPPLAGHTQQIPIQVQLIPHHPENQQLVIQQALSQHQVLQNIPRKTYAYISPYSQLENRELLNKILETQSDLRVKIRNEESSIHNEESLDSNQHNSVEHPPSTSTLHGVISTKTEEKEEEDDGKSSDDHHHKKNVHYKFEYAVNDKHTGDIKNQKEERHGDVVRGEYSLVEADGNVRTVKYYADWKRGFFAQVHNSKRRH